MRNNRISVLVLICFIFSLTSCFSYRSHHKHKLRTNIKKSERETVYLVNKEEYPNEFKILKKTKMYNFTNDSLCETKIYLAELKNNYFVGCIMGQFTALAFTLGQYPVKFPEKYHYNYSKIKDDESISFEFDLHFSRRVWFWDLFSPNKSLAGAISKEIRYQEQN